MLLIILFLPGSDIDGIYENGLTHRGEGLIGKYLGKNWIRWNEITKVEYGLYIRFEKRIHTDYIRIFSDEKETKVMARSEYDKHNDRFFSLLEQMIKEKSPQAKWEKNDRISG